jgi:hypothetical protein
LIPFGFGKVLAGEISAARNSTFCALRRNLRFLNGETNESGGTARDRSFSLADATKKDAAKLAGGFAIQAKVRVFFHYV